MKTFFEENKLFLKLVSRLSSYEDKALLIRVVSEAMQYGIDLVEKEIKRTI